MEQNAKIYEDLEKILVTREEIAEKVRELGRRITADYAGKEPVLVCILKGAVLFFSDLIREIDLPLTADFMAISSYGSATKTSGVVRVLKDLDKDIVGKDAELPEEHACPPGSGFHPDRGPAGQDSPQNRQGPEG